MGWSTRVKALAFNAFDPGLIPNSAHGYEHC